MSRIRPTVIDFETEPILPRPDYPPKPVGVSIMLPGEKPRYFAWGHPAENSCSFEDGKRMLKKVWASGEPLLCHNGKFDLDVAETFCGLKLPPWERCHDTMFLLALSDPHSPDLKLKPSAHRILGMPPEEQDAILQWAIENKLLARNAKEAGHLICKAPGKLVGRYANGDSVRTSRLFIKLHAEIVKRGMLEAYDRERRLMPVLLANEREGVRVNAPLLAKEAKLYGGEPTPNKQGKLQYRGGAVLLVDGWLRKRLKVKDLSIDSNEDLAAALISSGAADEEAFQLTSGGKNSEPKLSVAKDSLIGAVTDQKVLSALQYRSKLTTCVDTFIGPWLRTSLKTGGRIHTQWKQVVQADAGARTLRLSSSPNFQNVPKEFKEKKGKFLHPTFIPGLPLLPLMRRYMLPDNGCVWCKRDYSQQELRALGHFEDGVLQAKYLAEPEMDVHEFAAALMRQQFGLPVDREVMKTVGFALLYGMGLGALAERLGVSVEEARKIKNAYLSMFPGLKDLQDDLKQRAANGLPLRTWGGREYFVEKPRLMYGRMRTFEYKLINYLIQGSSADCSKEALIRYDTIKREGRFLVSVHDETNISVPPKAVIKEMALLREAMLSVEFDVPMLSDGSTGNSWGNLKKFKEPAYAELVH